MASSLVDVMRPYQEQWTDMWGQAKPDIPLIDMASFVEKLPVDYIPGNFSLQIVRDVLNSLYGHALREQEEKKDYYDVGGLMIPKLKVE